MAKKKKLNFSYYLRDNGQGAWIANTINKMSFEQFQKVLDHISVTYWKGEDGSLPPQYIQKIEEYKDGQWMPISSKKDNLSKQKSDFFDNRCPNNYEYVKSHYSGGHFVKGFCRKMKK